MLEVESVDGLHTALVEVASHPAQIEGLHLILGDFCHLFRNKLNCLKLSMYLLKQSPRENDATTWGPLDRTYRETEQFLEIIELIYRPMPLNLVQLDLGMFLDDRCRAWRDGVAGTALDLALDPPRKPAIGSFDPGRLSRGFDALVAWRSTSGEPSTSARLRWRTEGDQFHVDWADDGPYGLDAECFATGRGELLALPLLIRIMTAHGGTLSVSREAGLELSMRWPLDARPR